MKLRKEFEGKREKKKQTGEVGVALERLESPAACVWKETDDQQTEKKCAWMMSSKKRILVAHRTCRDQKTRRER